MPICNLNGDIGWLGCSSPWGRGAQPTIILDELPTKLKRYSIRLSIWLTASVIFLRITQRFMIRISSQFVREWWFSQAPQVVSVVYIPIATIRNRCWDVRNCYAVVKEGGCSKRRCLPSSKKLTRHLNIPHLTPPFIGNFP